MGDTAAIVFPGGAGTMREWMHPDCGPRAIVDMDDYWVPMADFVDQAVDEHLVSADEWNALEFVRHPLESAALQ
jgi:predicted Rossmann-fold nucleotide-binding protein